MHWHFHSLHGLTTGNVVGVADGDTITVLDVDKVQHEILYRLKQFLMENQS
ncbi:MAG: hypothetical protein Q7S71_04100 [Candidatus Nitrotoga sp.]|nr:hypothetical protein [Candidatus Nitrotoga sp.]